MRRGLVALLLVTAGMAGCIGNEDSIDGKTTDQEAFDIVWWEKALPFGDGHDHHDPADHQGLSTPNFELVGHNPLNSAYYDDQPAGAYFCGDAKPVEDGRNLAIVESRTDVGFAIADVSDPADPEWLGELVMPKTRNYDLAVAPSGQHVMLVTSDTREEAAGSWLSGGSADEQAPIQWRSPCTGGQLVPVTAQQAEDPAPRPMSLILVDISDPSQPTIVEQHPLLGSGHSVLSERIDGMDWIMVTTTRVPGPIGTPGVPENSIGAYEFYELDGEAEDGAKLRLLSVWKRQPDEESNRPFGPRGHDGALAIHPETGGVVAHLVGGDRYSLLDMSDPRNPEALGHWTVTGDGTPEGEGTLHSANPLETTWEVTGRACGSSASQTTNSSSCDKHYTVIGPEHAGHPEGYPSGIIWVMDTTDPTDPKEVAAWTLPADVNWNGTYQFSNHYMDIVDRTLFISMYHGGIWAVDLSSVTTNESFHTLDSIGVYLPSKIPEVQAAQPERWAPTSEEILALPDGSLVTFDGNTGLYTLRFDASDPAPVPPGWPIQPVTAG